MHSVLLVDDEVFARKGLKKLIDWEAYGFQVLGEADNGEDALLLIEELKPDLVITDIRMPVLDGLSLIRACMDRKMAVPEFIIISGYDDFSYAQQAVRFGVHDFILKPIDEGLLQSALANLATQLTQHKHSEVRKIQAMYDRMISSTIKGEMSEADILEWMDQLGLNENDRIYYILIEINDIHPWQSKPQPSDSELMKRIEAVYQNITQSHERLYMYEHRSQMGFLLHTRLLEAIDMSANEFCAVLQQGLTESLEYTVYLYIGQGVNHLSELRHSYATAKQALQYKFADFARRTIFYDEISSYTLHHIERYNVLYEQLVEYVEEENSEKCDEVIDAIFEQFESKQFAPEAIKFAIHRCVVKLLKVINEMEIDESEITTLKSITSWHDLNISPEELKRLFTQFTKESALLLNKYRKEQISGGIQKIKTYIEQHYHENISLKSIANTFYLNPVYLGQLFKKAYGVYFNEYLLELRVNEAKRLLRQTDKKVYEITDEVGFRNADYFVTQFAKVEQMTPTEYRNKLL